MLEFVFKRINSSRVINKSDICFSSTYVHYTIRRERELRVSHAHDPGSESGAGIKQCVYFYFEIRAIRSSNYINIVPTYIPVCRLGKVAKATYTCYEVL